MARIRTIKPDALLHRKVGRLSHLGFRVWIGQITQADDEGRFIADASEIRARVFGYHPEVTIQDTEAAIQEVAADGLTRLYSVNGTRYGVFPSWKDHQKIDHPSQSRLPAPPQSDAASMNPHGTLNEDSTKTREGSTNVRERSSLKGKGKGSKDLVGLKPDAGPSASPSPLDQQVGEVVEYLNTQSGRRFEPNGAQAKYVRARLKDGQPVERLKAVIRLKVGQWYQDPKMRKHLTPSTLFDKEKFEKYVVELSDNGNGADQDPYADLPHAWECRACGDTHEGTRGQVGSCLKELAG